jgi:LysR family hydrogen peroxide-inducible transcriptional activator
VDFVLLALPIRGEEFLCEELFREPLFACVPKGHRLASRRSIGITELRSEPFLLLKEGHCFRENALAACRRSKVHPNVVFESGQFSTIVSMVCAGMGVSVVPAMAVEKYSACRFVRLNDERTMRRVGLAQLRHRSPSRVQRVLVDEIRANAAARTSSN